MVVLQKCNFMTDFNFNNSTKPKSKSNALLVVIGIVFILVIIVMSIKKYSSKEETTLSSTDLSSFKASNVTNDQTNLTVTTVNPLDTVEKNISDNSTEDISDAGIDYGDYVKYSNENIFDKVNNRFWFIAPDRDFNYFEALNFVNDINDNQSEYWRLPSFEEINSLYDENSEAGQGFYRDGQYYPARVNSVFNSIGSGSWFWISDESENTDRANSINLHEGIQVSFNKNNPSYPVHLLLTKNN